MSSKVSKSEKTKLKFAQSNINHVYRGNTAENHHKPTVRQYGMQVVGKVQGTRRLPPPAWVPSIKAETGGLDSRVSIVPPGGSGWGAPTESRPTTTDAGATAEVGSSAVTTPLSAVNGSLSREAIGTSFEPAYARSLGASAEASTNETSQKRPVSDSHTDSLSTKTTEHGTGAQLGSTAACGTGTLSQPTAWTSRTQTTVASGGLAANKPFFQRPPPVATTTTSSARSEEQKPLSSTAGGGASEIVGEPTGWAAVNEEEPNFDERILFSDEEESQDDSKSALKGCTSIRGTDQNDTNLRPNNASTLSSAKQGTSVVTTFTESESASRGEQGRPYSSAFGTLSSTVYNEGPRDKTSDSWSTTDGPVNFSSYSGPNMSRHPTTMPFANAAPGNACGITTENECPIATGQYMQHPIATHGLNPAAFNDPYFPNQISTNRIASAGGGLLDSILPPTDADTELQNAQRQARTQEFRSAVERARVSRQQREVFPTEGDSLLQKSVVNLITEPTDAAHIRSSQPPSSQPLLLSSSHPGVPPVLGGIVPQQLLLPNVYHQATGQNRPAIAAAAAAATAAAMVGGAPARPSAPSIPPSNLAKVPHSQPMSAVPRSAANLVGSWQGAATLPPTISASGFNNPAPTVPQVLQSALNMATGGPPGAHPNGVYLNPDFFLERFLEILNQQQAARPQSTPQTVAPGRSLLQATEAVTSSSTVEPGRFVPTIQPGTPNKNAFHEAQPRVDGHENEIAELSQQLDSTLKTESPTTTQTQSTIATSAESVTVSSSTNKQQQGQQQAKRVPGLMDVKVPTSTSRNWACLCDPDDYLVAPSGRGGRGRSKLFTSEKSRGGSRGRRPGGRFASDDINITRAASGDVRVVGNQGGSHQDTEVTSNTRTWHSKTASSSRRVFNGPKSESDNLLTTSDIQLEVTRNQRTDAKTTYESEPDEYADMGDIPDDTTTSKRKYDDGTGAFDAGCTNRQPSGTSKPRSKAVHGDTSEGDASNQRRSDYGRQHERVRRGRGSGFYYSNTRAFANDDTSGRYAYSTEQKGFSRSGCSGGSGTFPHRGHRSGAGATQTEGTTRRRNLEEAVCGTLDHENRGLHAHGGDDYSNQRSTRDPRHDREWRSHEPIDEKGFQKGRGHARTLDIRRNSTYRDEYQLSDSEPRVPESRRNQSRQYHTNPRNRSHDGQRYTQKGTSRQGTARHTHERASSQSAEPGDLGEQPPQEKSTSFELCTVPAEVNEESDIPTVRVPAMDTSFKPSRPQYTRGSRSTTFQRGSGLRRVTSNRTVGAQQTQQQQQQQTKRSAGSNLQGSRRYRDLQNRYRDDKDGDGGAAAGGTGRSATGGDGTNTYGSTGSSGTDGCNDLGGNQNGGPRNTGSNNDCAPDTHKPTADSHELNSHTADDSEINDNNTGAFGSESSNRSHRHVSSAAGAPDRYVSQTAIGRTRDRKDRSTHISASGNRSSGGQRFHRQGFTKSGHSAASSRSADIAAIPPLMSIKPKGPFTRTPRDFDSVFSPGAQSSPQTEDGTEVTTKLPTAQSVQNGQPSQSDPNPEDPEDQEFLSDGFTKVVSKSSKKLARRRMQLELSAAAAAAASTQKHTSTRRPDESKPVSTHLKPQAIESNSPAAARTKNTDLTVHSKQSIRKVKPFPVKPTFMGPPMCMNNGTPVSTTVSNEPPSAGEGGGELTCGGPLTSPGKPWQSTSKTQPPVSDGVVVAPVTNTGRTWSKVVGTKALHASSVTVTKEPSVTERVVAKSAADPVWSTKRHSDEEVPVSEGKDGSTPVEAVSNDDSPKVDGILEPMKSIWPTSETVDDKEKSTKTGVAVSAEQTSVSPAMPASTTITCSVPTTTTAAPLGSTAVTNICKVRPQQQQPSPQVGGASTVLSVPSNATISATAPLSPMSNVPEQSGTIGLCTSDLVAMENEQLDCNFEANLPHNRGASRTMDDATRSTHAASRPVQTTWVKSLPSQFSGNYFEGRLGSGLENPFSTNIWPVGDMDSARGTNVHQSHYGQLTSDGSFTSPANALLTTDLPSKPARPITLAPRHQPYSVQHFSHSSAQAGDANHLSGMYASSLNETNKFSSSNPLSQTPQTAFAPMGGSVYVAPQQPSSTPPSQQANSFNNGWSIPPNAQPNPIPQSIGHGPRFRQRMTTQQLDLSSFGGYPFQTEIQNEYGFLPSVTGCIPAAPSGGLYSTVQGQPQSTYHHGSARSAMGPTPGANPWNLMGNSNGSTGMQTSNHEYNGAIPPGPIGSVNGATNGGNGGGLLPHPIPPGSYNNPTAPISSSPGSAYVTHPSYVGVIGGGRPGANDLSGTSGRQRGLPQGLYPTHNLAHSPSGQNQQQFQLHSAFYPSLSPSHQRVHLQQFPGSQGRSNIHNFVNPQNGLYAATYGPPPSQPTPPLHSQIGYPNNFSTESSVAPPGAFHSSVQSHSFSNLGLQPTHPHVHGHRSLQSSGPHMVSRNLGSVNSHGGSALVIPGTVGPSAVSALPGYPQPTPSAPLSVSGYPLKPVLPTL